MGKTKVAHRGEGKAKQSNCGMRSCVHTAPRVFGVTPKRASRAVNMAASNGSGLAVHLHAESGRSRFAAARQGGTEQRQGLWLNVHVLRVFDGIPKWAFQDAMRHRGHVRVW